MLTKLSNYDCSSRKVNPLVNDWNSKHTFIYSKSYVATDVKPFTRSHITRHDIEKYGINYEFAKVDNLKLAFDLEHTFSYDISEEEFKDIDGKLKECLSLRLDKEHYRLTTASRHADKKLSYHIIMQDVRMNKATITSDCFTATRPDEQRCLTSKLLSCFSNKYPNLFTTLNREAGKICLLDMVDPAIYAGHDFFKIPFAKDDKKPYPHIPVPAQGQRMPLVINDYLLTPFNDKVYEMIEFKKKIKEKKEEEEEEDDGFPHLGVDMLFYEKLGEKVESLHHCHYILIVKISKTLGYYGMLDNLCSKSQHYDKEKLREFYETTKGFESKADAREKLKLLILIYGKKTYNEVLQEAKKLVYEYKLKVLKATGMKLTDAEKMARLMARDWLKECENNVDSNACKPLKTSEIIDVYIEARKGDEDLYIFNDGTAYYYDDKGCRWEMARRWNDKSGIIIGLIKRALNESIDKLDIMVIIATLERLKEGTETEKTIRMLWQTYRLNSSQDFLIRKKFRYYEEKCVAINRLHVDVRGEEITSRPRVKQDYCVNIVESEGFKLDFECEEYKQALGFMKEYSTFDGVFNEEHFNSLRSITGACLSGMRNTDIKKLICIIGDGSNGKSTYFKLMSSVMGMGSTVSTQLITQTKSVARVEEKCLLEGKRFYVSDELDTNFNFNVNQLKKLTGQEDYKVRDENRGEVDIELRSLFVISTNELPRVEKMDGALEKRLVILPFLRKFDEDTGESIKRIKENKNGLVLFYLDCMRYFHLNGIRYCPLMELAKNEYKQDNEHPFDAFCREKLEVDPEGRMKLTDLIDQYKFFAIDYPNHEMPRPNSTFWKKQLGKNGFTYKDVGSRNNVWKIKIKEEIEEEIE